MRSDITASLDAIRTPAQATIDAANAIPAAVEAGEQAAYNEGYEAGKAAIELPAKDNPDAQYTQEQLASAVETGKQEVRDMEMKPAVDTLNAQISELGTKVGNLENELAQAGPNAVAAFKAELKAKYAEQQVAETQGETGFQALLD